MNCAWDAPHKSARPPAGNIGGFADGNKPSFARQGNFGAKYQEWCRQWAAALLPLLRPGALVFCFGGTRTWHRLACGLEDAGFEMWDTINWCSVNDVNYECGWLEWYNGSGFPKAQDISKLIDKINGDEREVVGKTKAGIGRNSRSESEFVSYTAIESEKKVDITAPASDQSIPWFWPQDLRPQAQP